MPQYLRTATPGGDWRSFKFIATSHMDDGQLYLVHNTVVVAFVGEPQYDANLCKGDADFEIGDEAVGIYHAEKIMVDKDGSTLNPGDNIYWSGTGGDPIAGTYNALTAPWWIGICVEAAAATATQVMIDLLGNKATLGQYS